MRVDCSCDMTFIVRTMDEVGKIIREKFKWVCLVDLFYLVIDNTGGGEARKKDTINHYTDLLTKRNVIVIFQVPQSPFSNVLDLGVWVSLQATVEKTHHIWRCEVGALVKYVNKTWNTGKLYRIITHVFK